jgi:hypothetical protein
MNVSKRISIIVFALAVLVFGTEIGERLSVPGVQSIIQTSEARIGRPLTPVSVAGVGRRTVRRCAVGVYNC